jgi:hypothetical protein
MKLDELGKNQFKVKSKDSAKKIQNECICQASDDTSYKKWVQEINEILDYQKKLPEILVNPQGRR